MDGYIGLEPSQLDLPPHRSLPLGAQRAREVEAPSKPLIFLHIPKTAGTSMMELLARNFAAGEVLRITDIHRPAADLQAEVEDGLAANCRLISGHFPFAAVAALQDQALPFTMLRDPVSRVVSLYRFWRIQEPHCVTGPAAQFACALAKSLRFDAFLACEHPLIVSATRDEMCKALCAGHGDEAAASDPASLFLQARETLNTIPFGLVERMSDSLRLLSHRLGVQLIEPIRLNRTDTAECAPPTCEEREIIIRNNLGDMALYDHASRSFSNALQKLELDLLYRSLGDRALTPLTAVSDSHFRWDAAMPVSGTGWNDRESLGDGTCYRFTSSPDTTIYFPNHFPDGDFSIIVRVAFFYRDPLVGPSGPVAPEQSLQFELNDRKIGSKLVNRMADEIYFTAHIDRQALKDPILKFTIKSNYGLKPSLFGSPDCRNILAAVRSITLTA